VQVVPSTQPGATLSPPKGKLTLLKEYYSNLTKTQQLHNKTIVALRLTDSKEWGFCNELSL